KLLTALVVLDNADLNDRICVSAHASMTEPTRAGLKAGVTYTVRDLLEALIASSANDAGVALAEGIAGSEERFAELMNNKARALGARDSHFTNATGLPDTRMLTTPYDFSIITREAFSQPFIAGTMRQPSVTIRGSDGKTITRKNHNKFLRRVDYPQILLKTGYTRSARHCYAGIAYYKDYRVSFVLFKSRKPWDDIARILNIKVKKKRK
ncbi:MAG: D-alanyl-D-alanine carboxypeptidase family protein, partial [Deltaproteobacteria bacterium]